MKGIAHLCVCFGLLQLAFGEGIQLCANNLKVTELGAEEHFLKISYRDFSGHINTVETEAYNMAGDKGFRCWGIQFDSFSLKHENTQFKVEIFEDDSNGGVGHDDLLGVVYVNSNDIQKGPVTIPVTSSGALLFRKI